MRNAGVLSSTALSLGLGNIVRVIGYRALKRAGIYRWLLSSATAKPLGLRDVIIGAPVAVRGADHSVIAEADRLVAGETQFFGAHQLHVGNPPDWLLNAFSGKRHGAARSHWSAIPDFDPGIGDIKIIWEMSRFGWAPVLARAYRTAGDDKYAQTLHAWIEDWWKRNPPNTGPNWKCAQEASIRLLNTLLAYQILSGPRGAGQLIPFVATHCRRISQTLSYAVGQDNNHGTSEAAGLFVGGMWLAQNSGGDVGRAGARWEARGRRLLERLVPRLVMPDGSFSQHSLTYHRLMLDTLSLAECFRALYEAPPFSSVLRDRAAMAAKWLHALIDPVTGDGPNLGANDGAMPYRLDQSTYRDFRPSLQLAAALFVGHLPLPEGAWDERLRWLGLRIPSERRRWSSDAQVFRDGGYVVLRGDEPNAALVLVRAPTGRFRPSQADALHVDLWCAGQNILRDGGTFSYAARPDISRTLASVAGHNTVEFDGHDQMPRLGRFLYGRWTKVLGDEVVLREPQRQSWSGRYVDPWGASHERTVTLGGKTVEVTDRVSGFGKGAVLRWRLAPAPWVLKGQICSSVLGDISVESGGPLVRVELRSGWESRYYLEMSAVPVLEVEIKGAPAVLKTTINLR